MCNNKLSGRLPTSLKNLTELSILQLARNKLVGRIPTWLGTKLSTLSLLNLRSNSFQRTITHELCYLTRIQILDLAHNNLSGNIPRCFNNFTILSGKEAILGDIPDNSLGSFHDQYEPYSMMNMQWLSGLRFLYHLDMNGINLSKAVDWLQVINTLSSLVELYLSNCELMHIHPHVASLNLSFLSSLDLSRNYNFNDSLVPRWLFSITNIVSLDLTWCDFRGPIPSSSEGFHNMTSIKLLHVSGNSFMNSSLVLKGLSSSNLVSLDIRRYGISSSVLDSLHNLTSLLSLELSNNQLTKTMLKTLCNFYNLREIDLSGNNFGNICLAFLLESFFKCKSPSLESISIEYSRVVGTIPDSIGRLSFLKYLNLDENLISGQIPFSIGWLSSLEALRVSHNRLNGSLPDSLGLLSNLKLLDVSYNLLTSVMTDAHFANLSKLKYLKASGNNLILRPRVANWYPHFQLEVLSVNSCWVLANKNKLKISKSTFKSTRR